MIYALALYLYITRLLIVFLPILITSFTVIDLVQLSYIVVNKKNRKYSNFYVSCLTAFFWLVTAKNKETWDQGRLSPYLFVVNYENL